MNIKEYEKIIKELEEKDVGAITKLEIVSYLLEYEEYTNLKETQKEKMLDFLYSYWINNDLIENNLYDMVEMIVNAQNYGFPNILQMLDDLDYKNFENIVNEKI